MRRWFLAAALLLASALSPLGEEIRDYRVALDIGPDAVVTVTEEITVYFDFPRHGIIREIPYSYRLSTGERFSLRISVDTVRADGEAVPVSVTRSGGRLVLKIGDPNRYVREEVTYLIRYRVERALRVYGEEVELYWNAIGTEWSMPIAHATVEVRPPEGVPGDEVRYVGYRGIYGSREPFELVRADGTFVGEAEGLLPGEGITVAVRFPVGYVSLPGFGRELLWFLADNAYAGIPLFALVAMLGVWWARGRDPRRGTIPIEYTPPEGVHPAAAGVLVDDRFDTRDLVAGVLSLAVKGHLVIAEIAAGDAAEPSDYELRRLDGKAPLSEFERLLLRKLFEAKGGDTVRLSDLKYEFYREIPALAARLYMDLTEAGFYPANPDRVRGFYRALGFGIVLLGIFLGFLWGSLYLGLAVGISGGIVLLFAPYMPRKTRKGMEVLRRVLGLEEYIRRAEEPYLEFAAAERHFEELLPYAMAFGMVERWTRKFEGLLKAPPSWYEGRFPTYSPYLFGTRLFILQRTAHAVA
ncbi:MAG: DUF2207 domain-containing protein, partial [Caldiserica bacterium]|nr:DUF2207 domain-containing protein [Caldisericota bacterium]